MVTNLKLLYRNVRYAKLEEMNFTHVPALSPSQQCKTFHCGSTLIEVGYTPDAVGYTVLDAKRRGKFSVKDVYSGSSPDKPILMNWGKGRRVLVFPGYLHRKTQSIHPTYFSSIVKLNQALEELADIQRRLQEEGLKCPHYDTIELCKQLFLPANDRRIHITTNPDFDKALMGTDSNPVQIIHTLRN